MRIPYCLSVIPVLWTLLACKGGGNTATSVTPVTPATPPLVEIVVSPSGSSASPGTPEAPTTLDHVQALLRGVSRTRHGALRVLLRGGLYPRNTAFTMVAADSGTADNPVEYVAYPGETPRLVGGASIDPGALHLVDSSDPNWARLDSNARAKIYVADLTAFKSGLGSLSSRSDNGGAEHNTSLEVFVDGEALTLARYPKAVEPESVNLAPQSTLRVTGNPSPDVTGDYSYKGIDGSGHPYYQLAKGGDTWTIAFRPGSGGWWLANDTLSSSFAAWGTYESFVGPAGNFDATKKTLPLPQKPNLWHVQIKHVHTSN